MSFKVVQILNSAVSGEMLQVAFGFQNSVKVTYVRHFFNFKCVLQMFIKTRITCGTLIIKIKSLICACSIVSRVFNYTSNEPLCGTLIIILGKNLCMLL